MNLPYVGHRYDRVYLPDGPGYAEADTIELELYVNGDLTTQTYTLNYDTDHYDLNYDYELPYGAQVIERVHGTIDGTVFSHETSWVVEVPDDAVRWIIQSGVFNRVEDMITRTEVRAFAISMKSGQPIAQHMVPTLTVLPLVVENRIQVGPAEWRWEVLVDPEIVDEDDELTVSVSGKDLRNVAVEAEQEVVVMES